MKKIIQYLYNEQDHRKWLCQNKNTKEYNQIITDTNSISEDLVFRQRIWHLYHNINKIPACQNVTCNNTVKWNTTKHAYQMFCSNNCNHEDGSLNEKRKKTNLIRYGVENNFERTEYVTQKRLEKTGFAYPLQSMGSKTKAKKTNMGKYGVDHPWKNPEIHNKTIKNRPEYAIDDETYKKLTNYEFMYGLYIDEDLNQNQISNVLNVAQSTVGLYITQLNITKNYNNSQIEREILGYIESLYSGQILTNNRTIIKPLELDIVLPERNIAFEVNGVYWHSELNGKPRNYHLSKYNLCKEKNIRLISILDSEWINHNEIVKSRICSMLGNNNRIYARKCEVVVLPNKEKDDFNNRNHIQQACISSTNLGLKYQNEIVACMTFGKSRFNNSYEYELLRYCSSLGTNVVGGASKLLSFFIKHHNPNSIIRYSDNRWNSGELYSRIGFTYIGESAPNFKYFKSNNSSVLYNRMKFQRHKLQTLLDSYDESTSAWQNMINNGYDRIWDCGNTKWGWIK